MPSNWNLGLSILNLKKMQIYIPISKDVRGSQIMTTNYILDVRFLGAANISLIVYKTFMRFSLGKLTVGKSYTFFFFFWSHAFSQSNKTPIVFSVTSKLLKSYAETSGTETYQEVILEVTYRFSMEENIHL